MARRSFGYVRKLPSGNYQASYIGPNGMRRAASSTFRTKTDAKRWLSSVEATIADGRWRDPVLARQNMLEYAEAWIDNRPGLRPRTVELYKWLLGRHLRPQLARFTLEQVTPMVVRGWRADLRAAGVSDTM